MKRTSTPIKSIRAMQDDELLAFAQSAYGIAVSGHSNWANYNKARKVLAEREISFVSKERSW